MRWTNSPDSVDDSLQFDKISAQLANCEFSVLKSELSEQMINEELVNYKKVNDNIAEKTEIVKEQIEMSKEQLVKAKEIRRNKLEYSSLARLIKQEPDRKEIVKKHEMLKEELLKKEEDFKKQNRVLEKRRKDFASFMMITKELLRDCNFETKTNNEEDDDFDAESLGEAIDVEEMITDD